MGEFELFGMFEVFGAVQSTDPRAARRHRVRRLPDRATEESVESGDKGAAGDQAARYCSTCSAPPISLPLMNTCGAVIVPDTAPSTLPRILCSSGTSMYW